jgi:uncharacterized DUF497 family protein
MEFEFDPHKSAMNLAKHGIDFEEAQRIWDDPYLLAIPARVVDEPRSIILGMHAGKIWAAVMTPRAGKVRIISVRRARDEERALYESF